MSGKKKVNPKANEFETGYQHGLALLKQQQAADEETSKSATERAVYVGKELLDSIDLVRETLLRTYADAVATDQVTRARMCDWAVQRIDKGALEIRELQVQYAAALIENDVEKAEKIRDKMVDAKMKAMSEGNVEVIAKMVNEGPPIRPSGASSKRSYINDHYVAVNTSSSRQTRKSDNTDDIDPHHYRNKYASTDGKKEQQATRSDNYATNPAPQQHQQQQYMYVPLTMMQASQQRP